MGARGGEQSPRCAKRLLKCHLGLLREDSVTRAVATGDGLGEACAVRLRDIGTIEVNRGREHLVFWELSIRLR